jgi:hypothetical protein
MLNSPGLVNPRESEISTSNTFRQVDRDTLFLLLPHMDDWLPEGHLAWFVVETAGQLDLTVIKSAWLWSPSSGNALGALVLGLCHQCFLQPQLYSDDHSHY